MPRKRSLFYDREFVAFKSRLLVWTLAPDDQTAQAMELIILATQVGADIVRLGEKTGLTVDQIRPLERRLREALIWNGRTVEAREWLHLADRDRMMAILTQALVALGGLKRELVVGGAAYSDLDGNELVRFRIPGESRLLSRFPRPRIGFEVSSVQTTP